VSVALRAATEQRPLRIDLSQPILFAFAGVLCVLIVMPLAWLAYYSLVDRGGALTFDNFRRLVTDPVFIDPLVTTVIVAMSVAVLTCLVGAPMGWLVARTDMPLRRTIRALVTASFVTPPFLGAIAWELLAAPNSGLLNQLYRSLSGAEADEHLFNIYSLPGLIFVIACYTFPYVFVLVANALDSIPGELEDASSILGGRTWLTARRVTIPLALPALLAGALVAFLQAMTLFGSPAILALPAGFHTMTTKIWSLFQYPPKPELAAAASLPLLLLTVALLRAENVILGRRSYSIVGGRYGAPRLIRLGRLRLPALALSFAVLLNPVFLPYAALLNAAFSRVASQLLSWESFTLHNIEFVFFELSATRLALKNTFLLGVLAATVGSAGDRLSHGAQSGRRPSGARLPRHRPGRDPRDRAGRRAVPQLHAPAVRALRDAVDPADCVRDDQPSGRLSAAAGSVSRGSSRARGCEPNPRRHAPAGAAPDHRAAAAHRPDRHVVLHFRRCHPRVVGGHHAVHVGNQGDLGADLRSQRERRSRRDLGARPHHAADHLCGGHPGEPGSGIGRRSPAPQLNRAGDGPVCVNTRGRRAIWMFSLVAIARIRCSAAYSSKYAAFRLPRFWRRYILATEGVRLAKPR
jgi:ABC-type sulfate transport system permease component